MNLIRKISITLFGVFALVYIFAKFDFLNNYFANGTGSYLRQHSIYWVAMAALALLIWLLEKRYNG